MLGDGHGRGHALTPMHKQLSIALTSVNVLPLFLNSISTLTHVEHQRVFAITLI
jgi:hypothetical protein